MRPKTRHVAPRNGQQRGQPATPTRHRESGSSGIEREVVCGEGGRGQTRQDARDGIAGAGPRRAVVPIPRGDGDSDYARATSAKRIMRRSARGEPWWRSCRTDMIRQKQMASDSVPARWDDGGSLPRQPGGDAGAFAAAVGLGEEIAASAAQRRLKVLLAPCDESIRQRLARGAGCGLRAATNQLGECGRSLTQCHRTATLHERTDQRSNKRGADE
jgi:hypothetical protein